MSQYHVFQEKMQQVINTLDEALSKRASDPSFKFVFDPSMMSEVFGLLPQDNLEEFIEAMRYCPSGEENTKVEEFKQFPELKRQTLVKMMELVSKKGDLTQDEDYEKQKFWYEKLRENL